MGSIGTNNLFILSTTHLSFITSQHTCLLRWISHLPMESKRLVSPICQITPFKVDSNNSIVGVSRKLTIRREMRINCSTKMGILWKRISTWSCLQVSLRKRWRKLKQLIALKARARLKSCLILIKMSNKVVLRVSTLRCQSKGQGLAWRSPR